MGSSREFLAGIYFRGKSFPWQQTQAAKEIKGRGLVRKKRLTQKQHNGHLGFYEQLPYLRAILIIGFF